MLNFSGNSSAYLGSTVNKRAAYLRVWTQWSRPVQTVWNSDISFKCQQSKCISQSSVKSQVLFCLMHNGSYANLCHSVPAVEQEVCPVLTTIVRFCGYYKLQIITQ